MRVSLYVALFALVLGAALANHHGGPKDVLKKFAKAVRGRRAQASEKGELQIEGKSKKFRIAVLGLVELDSNGDEVASTKVEKKEKVMNMMSTGDEPVRFSKIEGGTGKVMARCVTSKSEFNGTAVSTVTLRACVVLGNGTVNLGVDKETFDVAAGNTKIDLLLENYEFSTAGAKICVLTHVMPPKGTKATCGARPAAGANRRPRKCDLGDDTSMELSAVAAEIDGADPTAAGASPIWKDLTDDDAKLEEKNSKLIGRFCFQKPAAGKTIWYDPKVEMDDDDAEDDDSKYNSGSVVVVTLATVVMTTMSSFLLK